LWQYSGRFSGWIGEADNGVCLAGGWRHRVSRGRSGGQRRLSRRTVASPSPWRGGDWESTHSGIMSPSAPLVHRPVTAPGVGPRQPSGCSTERGTGGPHQAKSRYRPPRAYSCRCGFRRPFQLGGPAPPSGSAQKATTRWRPARTCSLVVSTSTGRSLALLAGASSLRSRAPGQSAGGPRRPHRNRR
jgi:hypothetical protein